MMFKKDSDRICKELDNILEGEVHSDEHHRYVYSKAACIYRIPPIGVVIPKNEEDIVNLVRYCTSREIPLTPRGSGTAVAGQSVNKGLIVDFTPELNSVLSFDEDSGEVTVQPGLVKGRLNDYLNQYGVFLPPDPSSSDYCTVGGMVGNNSSGLRSVKYGVTSDYVTSLKMISGDGEPRRFGKGSELDSDFRKKVNKIIDELSEIENPFPGVLKNSSGYNLEPLINDAESIHRALCGSEGTLGIITEITFKTKPLPEKRLSALMFFDALQVASDTVNAVRKRNPSALEIMDETFLDFLREKSETDISIPEKAGAALLIEMDGQKEKEIEERFFGILENFGNKALNTIKAKNEQEAQRLWDFRKSASPKLRTLPGEKKSIRFIEDAIVPPDKITDYIVGLREILDENDVFAVIFGHAGDGNLHVNPLLNPEDPGEIKLMRKIAGETHSLISKLGGSMSGEHGDGRLRSEYLEEFYGSRLYNCYEDFKNLFDPMDIFNPGIIAGDTRLQAMNENLRFHSSGHTKYTESENCYGCGKCRDFCPPFKKTNKEINSPRAWNQIIKADSSDIPDDEFMSNCLNCRRCVTGCPSGVESHSAIFEYRTDRSNISFEEAILSHPNIHNKILEILPDSMTKILSEISPDKFGKPVNLDISKLKHLIPSPTLKDLYPRKIKGSESKIVYFHGCFAGYMDPEGHGSPTVELLKRFGFDIAIPEQFCCGIPAISNGNPEAARKMMTKNLEILDHYVSRDYTITTGCPSCYTALKSDYVRLMGKKAEKTARQTRDIYSLLFNYLSDTLPRNLKNSRNLAFHKSCHSKENGFEEKFLRILEKTEDIELNHLPRECCGMAGTFGLKSSKTQISEKIGKKLFKNIKEKKIDSVLTSCGMCQVQFKHFTEATPLHPLKLIEEILSGEIDSQPRIAGEN